VSPIVFPFFPGRFVILAACLHLESFRRTVQSG